MKITDRVLGQRVDPSVQHVVKFWPSDPPRRGGILLVDGVRYRVTRCKVRWDGYDWRIITLRVKRTGEQA